MKTIKTSVAAMLLSAAIFLVSSCSKEKEAETLNPANGINQNSLRVGGPSANGQGALFLDYEGFTPGVQQFSFHATTDENGNVTGSFETKWADNGRLHGTIDCLSILADGKTAIMSGTLTHVAGATYIDIGFEVGQDAWFKVQDNGEGANATEDSFSDLYADFNVEPCTYDYGLDLIQILHGNIQVKP